MTVFVTSGPELQRCATPFYMANIAAAMDNEAEMIFQIDGVLLMKKGVAEGLVAKEGGKVYHRFHQGSQGSRSRDARMFGRAPVARHDRGRPDRGM